MINYFNNTKLNRPLEGYFDCAQQLLNSQEKFFTGLAIQSWSCITCNPWHKAQEVPSKWWRFAFCLKANMIPPCGLEECFVGLETRPSLWPTADGDSVGAWKGRDAEQPHGALSHLQPTSFVTGRPSNRWLFLLSKPKLRLPWCIGLEWCAELSWDRS